MPKGDQETTAIRLAKQAWGVYAGCDCEPSEVPEGLGYDLGCSHHHVEVKGTGEERPGFRFLTEGEFDAARRDPLFELWLVTGLEGGAGVFHVIGRDEILSSAKLMIQWQVPLGRKRLEGFRENALQREKRRRPRT
jgi:hypothetical protein